MENLKPRIEKRHEKAAIEEGQFIERVREMLKEGKPVRDGEWNGKEIEILNQHLFMTAKPVVYLVNIGRD